MLMLHTDIEKIKQTTSIWYIQSRSLKNQIHSLCEVEIMTWDKTYMWTRLTVCKSHFFANCKIVMCHSQNLAELGIRIW